MQFTLYNNNNNNNNNDLFRHMLIDLPKDALTMYPTLASNATDNKNIHHHHHHHHHHSQTLINNTTFVDSTNIDDLLCQLPIPEISSKSPIQVPRHNNIMKNVSSSTSTIAGNSSQIVSQHTNPYRPALQPRDMNKLPPPQTLNSSNVVLNQQKQQQKSALVPPITYFQQFIQKHNV
jgi:hypothetical protein